MLQVDINALRMQQSLELGLSQFEVSKSPVVQQELIEEVQGKRAMRRQGYRSWVPKSISSSIAVATEMSSFWQQPVELQIAQEELQ